MCIDPGPNQAFFVATNERRTKKGGEAAGDCRSIGKKFRQGSRPQVRRVERGVRDLLVL